MKVKYKLIIIFNLLIIFSSIPISLYILYKEEQLKFNQIINQGKIYNKILSRAVVNLYLSNGGDIKSTQIDAKDMIDILKPLKNNGLIYADIIFTSKDEKLNGSILARYSSNKFTDKFFPKEIITSSDLKRLKKIKNLSKIKIENIKGFNYEIIYTAFLKNNPLFICRLVFSESIVLEPINNLKKVIFSSVTFVIILISFLSIFFSKIITTPIAKLIKGITIIGSGDFDFQIPVTNNDEFGRLAKTINHLVQIVKLERTELQTINKELQRIDKLKDEFLANMSHELRTPLYGIIGLAESLINGISGELNNIARYNLSLISTSGKRLSTLVNDILDFSQLKHGQIILNKTNFDLYSILNLIIAITNPLLKDKNLKIKTSIKPGEFFINADENRLQQILFNIVGNSIKFTESGEINIFAAYDKDNQNKIIVSIKDTGAGIPEENQDYVFKSFEQGDGSISRNYGGTGLGLTITKRLIQLHGGKIWFETKINEGTCFHFLLDKSDQELIGNEKIFDESEKKFFIDDADNKIINTVDYSNQYKNFHILVVDDEPVNLQVLINNLTMEGYNVSTASTGTEAVNLIDNNMVPDLIILDLMLPGLSGYDVCSKIRENFSQSELPILMLTAKSKPEDLIIGFDVGANDFLRKPVDKNELIARVTSLLTLKKSVKEHNELNILKTEINIAHEIQDSLLAGEIPKKEKFNFAVRYIPMYELGGDFYEINYTNDEYIDVLIADVSGHGIPAAFISSMLKVALSFYRDKSNEPAQLLYSINKVLYDLTHDQFITALYAHIDLKNMKIIQSCAGHWPIIINNTITKKIRSFIQKSIPIGWVEEENYKIKEIKINKNDRLIFYTDGIIEASTKDHQMYGIDNFNKFIIDNSHLDNEKFCDKLIKTINNWRNEPIDATFEDDLTLIVLDIL